MTLTAASFLDTFKTAANAATAAEVSFRREVAGRIKTLEQERAFAFRRLNLMHAVAETVASAESEEIAVASALTALRAKLGWWEDSEARAAVLSHFAPVAKATFASLSPDEEVNSAPDVLAGLREFETWYAESHASPFWVLFEHYIPETPVVDF